MHFAVLAIPLSVCALAATSAGCTVGLGASTDLPPVSVDQATGSLTVRWLVAGTTDPSVCDAYAASAVELVVYDESGNEVTTADEPCGSFSLTLALPEGTYTAEATLVDASSGARSVTKPLSAIEVVAGTDIAIDLDFPASSIL
jgi:hypothetical protein